LEVLLFELVLVDLVCAVVNELALGVVVLVGLVLIDLTCVVVDDLVFEIVLKHCLMV